MRRRSFINLFHKLFSKFAKRLFFGLKNQYGPDIQKIAQDVIISISPKDSFGFEVSKSGFKFSFIALFIKIFNIKAQQAKFTVAL